MSEQLSGKQKAFVEQYFICNMNGTQAVKEAGYKVKNDNVAAVTAHNNLRNPKIARAIKERMATLAMDAEEALARIADHARGDINDLLDENGNLDITKAWEQKKTHLIKSISKSKVHGEQFSKDEIKFELYDAQSALVQIMKVHNLTSKVINDGEIVIKVVYDDDDTG